MLSQPPSYINLPKARLCYSDIYYWQHHKIYYPETFSHKLLGQYENRDMQLEKRNLKIKFLVDTLFETYILWGKKLKTNTKTYVVPDICKHMQVAVCGD